MKIAYDIINKNIEVYAEAKSSFPAIEQWERGEVGMYAMQSLGLTDFANFHSFLKRTSESGYSPVMQVKWKDLKQMICDKTSTERFKTFIKNRTQKKFDALLSDAETFDRIMNGSWKCKPRTKRNGRVTLGTRNYERMEGLEYAIIPIINYVMANDVELFKDFGDQSAIHADIQWYTYKSLNFDSVPKREIEITNRLLTAFSETLERDRIDFRKLNIEYVVSAIGERIKKAMNIPAGKMLKCVMKKNDNYGKQELIEGKYYEVASCSSRSGYFMVGVKCELGYIAHCRYSHFEDMGTHRDDLLSSLFN